MMMGSICYSILHSRVLSSAPLFIFTRTYSDEDGKKGGEIESEKGPSIGSYTLRVHKLLIKG